MAQQAIAGRVGPTGMPFKWTGNYKRFAPATACNGKAWRRSNYSHLLWFNQL